MKISDNLLSDIIAERKELLVALKIARAGMKPTHENEGERGSIDALLERTKLLSDIIQEIP